jgi:hypothetical protein
MPIDEERTPRRVRHTDNLNVRFIRTLGSDDNARTGPRRGARGGAPPQLGRRGRGQTANLMIGVRYQRSTSDQRGTFDTTSGRNRQSAWDVPMSFTFPAWGIFNTLRAQFNRRHTATANLYAFTEDVTGAAGIAGVSTDPFAWGIPNLSFSTFTSIRDLTPATRTDQTVSFGLTQMLPRRSHTLRWGGEWRLLRNDTRTETNPRGSFVFTGVYSGSGAPFANRTGIDFADFLLGLAQQATLQHGPGLTRYRSQAVSFVLQDDWRVRGDLTVNVGLRYEYLAPYEEADDRLVNLDVPPDFRAAVPVRAGSRGEFTGAFPEAGIEADGNNLAPRIGVAWRVRPRTTVRTGYSIHYSAPTYASIAQRLAAQPPFAVSDTRLGTASAPLSLATVFAGPGTITTTNDFGVDRNYRLGYVQMWNLEIQRELARALVVSAEYAGTRGSRLDLQRAPNRGPAGPLIPDVAPFIWESSEGRSIMHSMRLRLRKRPSRGLGGAVTYVLSKGLDNASTLGSGGIGFVAQDDHDLDAEWGRSSFDQRHRLDGHVLAELPFGANRRWLNDSGIAAKLLGGWTWTANVNLATGTPLTVRVLGSAAEVGRGTNGTLRADYTGQSVALDDPTIQQFFNTSAFAVPPPERFGNAGRNTITGPGLRNVGMSLMKIIPLPHARRLTIGMQASNVLNTPQFAAVDTVVNSPTFGQVIAMRPMRTVQIHVRAAF